VIKDRQKMKSRRIIFAAIGVAVLIAAVSLYLTLSAGSPVKPSSTYAEINKSLKQDLELHGLLMSSPIHFRDEGSISKYCQLFADQRQQDLVEYCTSTEVKDKEGEFLGNIHMVGSSDMPQLILVLFQTDGQMSQIETVKTMFDTAIVTTVCACWADLMPDGMASTSDWIDGLKQFHQSDEKPHSKSKQIRLEQKTLQLELTSNENGYLWQLYIYA